MRIIDKLKEKIGGKLPDIKGRPQPSAPTAGFLASGRRYVPKKGNK